MTDNSTGFQPGDIVITLSETQYRLRLTLGALAEMSARFGGEGPLHLAQVFRDLSPDAARVLLACLLRPCHPSKDVDRLAASASEPDLARAIAVIAAMIAKAFGEIDA